MAEQLTPADIDLVPIGIVLPFIKGEVHKDFYEFNGQTILQNQDPELFEALTLIDGEVKDLFEGWGGKIGKKWAKLPKLERDQVVEMIWGVKSAQGFDAVLAIRGKRS